MDDRAVRQEAPKVTFISRSFVDHPCKILWATLAVLVFCSILGVALAEPPDFDKAHKGFEPRGTPLALRLNALRQLEAYPRHRYCGWICPKEEGFDQRRLSDGDAAEDFRSSGRRDGALSAVVDETASSDTQEVVPRQLQSSQEFIYNPLGRSSCYGPLAGITAFKPTLFLVLGGTQEADVASPALLRDLCEAGAVLEASSAYRNECDAVHGDCCPIITLPRALAAMELILDLEASGSDGSAAVRQFVSDARSGCRAVSRSAPVWQRYTECSEALLSGACNRAGNFICSTPSLSARCQAINPMVHLVMTYLVTRAWQPSSALAAAGIALPVRDETETLLGLREELPQYFSGEASLQVVAAQIKNKFPLFQRRLFLDSAWAALALATAVACMISHTRSVFISLMTVLQVVLSMTFSYFLHRIIFRAPFFTFLNMNMLFCTSAIGIDDVFVFMDAYRQSFYFLSPETDLKSRVEWTFRRAFGAMFVTTLTTAVAFSANLMSPIIVVKNFGAFASLVIMVDFVCMMLVLPASLLISEFGALKDCCRWCGAWNRPMPEVWAKSSKRHVVEDVFERWLASVVVTGRWFFFFVLTALGVMAFTQVFKLRSSDSELNQLFVDGHLVERFDQHWCHEFLWFNDLQSIRGLPVIIVAGVVPSDTGDYEDPDNFGPMVRAHEDLASATSQTWYAELCRRLPEAPLYNGLFRGDCLFEGVRQWTADRCGGLNISCCPGALPQPWPLPSLHFSICARAYAAWRESGGFAGQVPADAAIALEQVAEGMKGRYELNQGTAFDPEGRLVAATFGYTTTEAATAKVDLLASFYETVESWASTALEAPSGAPKPFWWTAQMGWYSLMKGLQEGAYSAAGAALGFCMLVLLLVVGNAVMALYALVTIAFVLSIVCWCLMGLGWVLDLNTAVVMAICVGMCVDFVCHISHAYVQAPARPEAETRAEERSRRTTYAMGTMGISVTFGAISTFLASCAMLPSQVQFFFQFGVFLSITMLWSLLYALFYYPALAAIAGVVGSFGDIHALVGALLRRKGAAAGGTSHIVSV